MRPPARRHTRAAACRDSAKKLKLCDCSAPSSDSAAGRRPVSSPSVCSAAVTSLVLSIYSFSIVLESLLFDFFRSPS
ncbi:hypothetical protein SETIT_5G059800v2 [Setaria italica]|uniref:Uncharacterized protein n=1 Tax=Setaria italica TaxID=4555 RepID=A0A368R1P6_SETIT|nr:hypothetical protein SETIT_5G059800v2 [Setaria italica]